MILKGCGVSFVGDENILKFIVVINAQPWVS